MDFLFLVAISCLIVTSFFFFFCFYRPPGNAMKHYSGRRALYSLTSYIFLLSKIPFSTSAGRAHVFHILYKLRVLGFQHDRLRVCPVMNPLLLTFLIPARFLKVSFRTGWNPHRVSPARARLHRQNVTSRDSTRETISFRD